MNRDAVNAEAYLLGLANTMRGGVTYRAVLSQPDNAFHADDLKFFFGYHHEQVVFTPANLLLDWYYPEMIRNFLKHGRPDQGSFL